MQSSSPEYRARSSSSPEYQPRTEGSPRKETHDSVAREHSPRRRSSSFSWNKLSVSDDDPPLFVPPTVKSRKKEYAVTEKELKQLQEERKTSLKINTKVPRTRSEEELVRHYKEYTRRSPVQKETKLVAINLGLRPLEALLPSSVIVLVSMHGRTKEPFTAPTNVERHIGTDFGTCMFDHGRSKRFDRHLMGNGFLESREKSTGENIKQKILTYVKKLRAKAEKIQKEITLNTKKFTKLDEDERLYAPSYVQELTNAFYNSKHHDKVKKIKKGMPLFNKAYSMNGPDGHETHATHSIYVRADLPGDRVAKEDCFFELRTEETTLKAVLKFLAGRGVTHVTLFDYSCQPDEREAIHRTRYGGTRKK